MRAIQRIWARPAAVLLCAVTTAVPAWTATPQSLLEFWGPQYETLVLSQSQSLVPPEPFHAANPAERLRYWNQIAIDASGLDHTPGQPSFGEQLGPGRSARAMAIVHIAISDAVLSIPAASGATRTSRALPGTSVDAAIARRPTTRW